MRHLKDTETVVVAWAEFCSGPGWSNAPIWFIAKDNFDGKMRMDCLQPSEQTSDMHIFFRVNAAASSEMTNLVKSFLSKKPTKKRAIPSTD